ncbi:MAG: SEC-C metal-binding domain-containing protein [Planctomycetota bacterium]
MKFGSDKLTTLPKQCLACDVRFICNGGCPKNRIIKTADGERGLNYLCAGYRMFFSYVAPCMEAMAEELRNQRPAANVMYQLNVQSQQKQAELQAAGRSLGRNDPCPCGSGKKYKNCCMRLR